MSNSSSTSLGQLTPISNSNVSSSDALRNARLKRFESPSTPLASSSNDPPSSPAPSDDDDESDSDIDSDSVHSADDLKVGKDDDKKEVPKMQNKGGRPAKMDYLEWHYRGFDCQCLSFFP